MKKTIESRSLTEEAYRKLKQFMLQQKIVPGQKLLYRELTGLLHMSKTPIVNALNRLEQEGFVVSEPNCGYYLKPLDIKEITDSSEVREALEARAVQQAIKLGKQNDMVMLEKKLRTLEAYPSSLHDKKRFVLNAEFHLQLADISENRVLKYLLKRNFEHIILRVNLDAFASENTAASNQEHRKLLVSLKKGDISNSVHLVETHIQKTRDFIIRFLAREALEEIDTMDFFEEGRQAF
jgi:DNA-binding GntR family transcriptional regulator